MKSERLMLRLRKDYWFTHRMRGDLDGKKNKKTAAWNVQVPKPLDGTLTEALASGAHLTKSEFIRDAVREKLEKMGAKPEPQATVA